MDVEADIGPIPQFRDHIHRLRRFIDKWSAENSNVVGAHPRIAHAGSPEIHGPVRLRERWIVGVKRINGIVHGGDEHDIVNTARDRQIGNDQRQSVDAVVNGPGEELPESRGLHVAGVEDMLAQIRAGTIEIVLRHRDGYWSVRRRVRWIAAGHSDSD